MNDRTKYSDELKKKAVKMVVVDGHTRKETGRILGIPSGTIGSWVASAIRAVEPADPGDPLRRELFAEGRRLREEIAQVRIEIEFVRKTAENFSEDPQPGNGS